MLPKHCQVCSLPGVMRELIPKPHTVWSDPATDLGPWRITFHWVEVEGRALCAGIDIRSYRVADKDGTIEELGSAPIRPVTATLIRALRIAELIQANKRGLRAQFELFKRFARDAETEARFDTQEKTLEAARDPSKGGRPPDLGTAHFKNVATAYREAIAQGSPHARKAVADRFGVAPATAAKWIARARELHLLRPAPGRGRPGEVAPPKTRVKPKKPSARHKRSSKRRGGAAT